MRAGPSGRVRPCSQFLIVAAVNPNRAANRDWLRPRFCRIASGLIGVGRSTWTWVTRMPGTCSPLAYARAWLRLVRRERPAAVLFGVRLLALGLDCFGIAAISSCCARL